MALDRASSLNVCARFLLEHGAIPSTCVFVCVSFASDHTHTHSWHYHAGVQSFELFRWLVAACLDVNAQNSDGRKPIFVSF